MNKDNKLGMGLGALLSTSNNTTEAGVKKINISQINPNPSQPRKKFKETELNELAISIKKQGLIQPIIVRPTNNNQFQIIAGERRWRASQLVGLHEVDCVVRELKETEVLEAALIEKANELSQKYNSECIAIPCDLSTKDGVDDFVHQIADKENGIDFLINNAGAAWGEPFESFSEGGWDKVMDLNVKSLFFLTQQMKPLLTLSLIHI